MSLTRCNLFLLFITRNIFSMGELQPYWIIKWEMTWSIWLNIDIFNRDADVSYDQWNDIRYVHSFLNVTLAIPHLSDMLRQWFVSFRACNGHENMETTVRSVDMGSWRRWALLSDISCLSKISGTNIPYSLPFLPDKHEIHTSEVQRILDALWSRIIEKRRPSKSTKTKNVPIMSYGRHFLNGGELNNINDRRFFNVHWSRRSSLYDDMLSSNNNVYQVNESWSTEKERNLNHNKTKRYVIWKWTDIWSSLF